jgi:outer membrane lipoprotein-sorting protein
MRGIVLSSVFASVLCSTGLLPSTASAADLSPTEIIQKFAAKEAAFRKARESYTYRQSVKMEELDGSGNVQGKWEIVSDIIFGPNKQRQEKVIYAPVNTLHLLLTPQDEQDLRSVQPFVLTTDDVGKYDIQYIGKEKLDEIDCYKFTVKPKTMLKGERYFEGDIWVDDRDLQIVKTYGKGVGLLKKGEDNQFPRFETYREQIDGKYWFPTYTRANDTLHFKDSSQRIRMVVKYENYKRFGADTSITFGDEVPDTPKTK